MRRRFARLVKVCEGVVERRHAIALHILRRSRAHPDPVAHVTRGRPGRRRRVVVVAVPVYAGWRPYAVEQRIVPWLIRLWIFEQSKYFGRNMRTKM